MDFSLPSLQRNELVALQLRAIFEKSGYRLFRMGSFEEYDLYMQNKPFLSGDDIITFTGADGRLMALKPDVTLSIVKNTRKDEVRRVYYNESVFRRSRETGEYREISQMGLEFIGGEMRKSEAEVVTLAAKSLSIAGDSAIDLSHMGFIEAMMASFTDEKAHADALIALRDKSPHMMRAAAKEGKLADEDADRLALLAELSGPFETAFLRAKELAAGIAGTEEPLYELALLWEAVQESGLQSMFRLDFSILNDVDYYNGLIFQGFVCGVAHPVLAGGRYDNLMARFEKEQGAVGFALYLNELERQDGEEPDASKTDKDWLRVALPKGRMGDKVYQLFQKAGLSCEGILEESRKLVFEDTDNRVSYYLVKPSDVDSYVEHGAADIGVVGKDVLLESSADVLELLDMKMGACRLAVAGKPDFSEDPAIPLRVATKYPAIARRYYAEKSRSVEVIQLHGSIELAPLTGLSDVIVDIVESGSTLRENDLAVLAEIAPSSARLVANRASWRFKEPKIRALLRKLEEIL